MIELLMDCHERELMKLEPCHSTNIKYARWLIQRGLITPHIVATKGKRIIAFYVTALGRIYLSNL